MGTKTYVVQVEVSRSVMLQYWGHPCREKQRGCPACKAWARWRKTKQIVYNLLANAVKFTSQGRISVEARTVDAGHRLLLTVADTGIGMAPEMQQRIFESFVQADESIGRRFGGTGLGLPLTKAMVDANRAQFAISSTPNEGTLVEVTFPSPRVLAD